MLASPSSSPSPPSSPFPSPTSILTPRRQPCSLTLLRRRLLLRRALSLAAPACVLPLTAPRLRSASCSVAPPFCLLAVLLLPDSDLFFFLLCFFDSLFCFLELTTFHGDRCG
ncbi:uncharacterized protein DS421_15g495970 [Arachis hypogaea]|nr:uncharacterized protein DS421_15g495970 [Arachis hypogaea]